jgi:hypothetical protein
VESGREHYLTHKFLSLRCSLGIEGCHCPQRSYAALQLVHAGLVKRSTTLWFYIDGAQNNAPLLNFLENSYNNARAARLCAAQKLDIFERFTSPG